jgi:hypothetical protein
MSFYILHPDGSKRGPFKSESEAYNYMGENASFDTVIEEKNLGWKILGGIIGIIMKIISKREYGK